MRSSDPNPDSENELRNSLIQTIFALRSFAFSECCCYSLDLLCLANKTEEKKQRLMDKLISFDHLLSDQY